MYKRIYRSVNCIFLCSFIKMLTGSVPPIYHNFSLFPSCVPEILGISHSCCFLCLLDGLSFFVRKEKVGTYLEVGWSFACLALSNDQPDSSPETVFQKVILRWISEMCSSLISIFKNKMLPCERGIKSKIKDHTKNTNFYLLIWPR